MEGELELERGTEGKGQEQGGKGGKRKEDDRQARRARSISYMFNRPMKGIAMVVARLERD